MIVSHNPQNSKRRVSGFTLIELLVVIAIIAVLAAMVIPIAKMVGEASNNTHSLTNLKSIGTALTTYAAENENFYPPVENETDVFDWTNKDIELEEEDLEELPFWVRALIHEAISNDSDVSINVFNCPGLRWKDEDGEKMDADEILLTYGATDAMLGHDDENDLDPTRPRSVARMEEAARTMLVVETQQAEGRTSHPHVSWDDAERDLSRGDVEDMKNLDFRFKKVIAALMADGSATSFRFKDKEDIEEPHWTGEDYESIR